MRKFIEYTIYDYAHKANGKISIINKRIKVLWNESLQVIIIILLENCVIVIFLTELFLFTLIYLLQCHVIIKAHSSITRKN